MDVLVKRGNQKRVTLRVKDENTLAVSAPANFPTDEIDKIIKENKAWINKKMAELAGFKANYSLVYSFEQTMINGKIMTVYEAENSRSFVTEEAVYVSDKAYPFFEKRRKELIKIIKNYADKRLRAAVSDVGTKLGVCPTDISIKFIKGKRIWGKCDVNKKIIIDSRVVMLPLRLQRYVILHEFAHLAVFDHSKRFWEIVEKYVPDYKTCRNELKQYSFLRDIYC